LREQPVGGGLGTLLAVALLLGHLEDDLLETKPAAHRLPHGLDEAPARSDHQVTYMHMHMHMHMHGFHMGFTT
jgi:hypothetical protein